MEFKERYYYELSINFDLSIISIFFYWVFLTTPGFLLNYFIKNRSGVSAKLFSSIVLNERMHVEERDFLSLF